MLTIITNSFFGYYLAFLVIIYLGQIAIQRGKLYTALIALAVATYFLCQFMLEAYKWLV